MIRIYSEARKLLQIVGMTHSPNLRTLPAMLAVLALAAGVLAPAAHAAGKGAAEQLEFGIRMAKRGLWNEALFRFNRVLEERPGDPRVLNNIAVAYEATGQFDLALEHYKKALERDSANRELRRNYAQFVEFYQGQKPDKESASEAASPESEADQAPNEATEAESPP